MAEQSNAEAKTVLNRALKLRETIYRLFAAGIANQKPLYEDLTIFNKNLSRSMKDSQIILTTDGYAWNLAGNQTRLDWILNPIIRSAAEILVSDERNKVKACADSACGWLFIDVSRNRSRRWCDMKDCGNRAKASRFYRKKVRQE
jgi:predicted RNA-binding Zn ribbon-like protein